MKTGNENVAAQRLAWRPREWGQAVSLCHVTVHGLIASGRIASVRAGGARLITTQPGEFLVSLAAQPVASLTGEANAVKAQKPPSTHHRAKASRERREAARQAATASVE